MPLTPLCTESQIIKGLDIVTVVSSLRLYESVTYPPNLILIRIVQQKILPVSLTHEAWKKIT